MLGTNPTKLYVIALVSCTYASMPFFVFVPFESCIALAGPKGLPAFMFTAAGAFTLWGIAPQLVSYARNRGWVESEEI